MKAVKVYSIIKDNVLRSVGALVFMLAPTLFTACSEEINEGNFAIKSELTVADYVTENKEDFSSFAAVLNRVNLSESDNASSLMSVLSTRGNYTVFAPNNAAVAAFCEQKGVATVEELTQEDAILLAYSCIIDNGDESPYEEADFPTPGTFMKSNLNDRLLPCEMQTEGDQAYFVINKSSRVIKTNIELSNGMLHVVDAVIAPSSNNVYELIAEAGNMKVFAKLMELTSWADTMALPDRDVEYELVTREQTYKQSGVGGTLTIPQRRYLGYTAFAETDDVYESAFNIQVEKDEEGNISNWDAIFPTLKRDIEAKYPNLRNADLKSADNAINYFVAYHILEGKIAYNRFVHHYNEFNYKYGQSKDPQTTNVPTNVWDYYTTVGQSRGLMKITQLGDKGGNGDEDQINHEIFINRISVYNNTPTGNYEELGATVRGIKILPSNGQYDNSAQNGFYFPIDGVLWYDADVRKNLGSERIRIDMTTMLPEIASNGVRGQGYFRFPEGYFDNITNESSGTVMLYLHDAYSPNGGAWRDFQGDEIMACGQYDFVVKLPPVPQSGTYELRMGASHNTMRGMAQIYLGTDPYRLSPVGLPYDMRQTVGTVAIPWVADTDDQEENAENDKNMRNQGYMKAPRYFTVTNGKGDQPCREVGGSAAALRRIVTVANFDANKTYYLRFKSALKKLDAQLFLDYYEFVPTIIYNGAVAEDIW